MWKPDAASVSAWMPAAAALLVGCLMLAAVNANALWSLVALWTFSGHEYGFLVVAAACWLAWRERAALLVAVPQPTWRGLLVAVPISLASWIASLVDVQLLQLVMFIAGVAVLVFAVLGMGALHRVAYPIVLLVLALPVWNYLRPVLQDLTVAATAFSLRALGTPVFVDETFIHVPQRTILVLSECSGVQYFQAGVTLGALHAGFSFGSWRTRALVIAVFAATSIGANWLRVLAIALSGELTELQHFGIGWGVFSLAMLVLFALSMRLQQRPHRVMEVLGNASGSTPNVWTIGLITAALMASGPAIEQLQRNQASPGVWRLDPPSAEAGWSGPYVPPETWRSTFQGADAESFAAYRSGHAQIGLYRAYYANQRQGKEAVNELNQLFEPLQWAVRGGQAGVRRYDVQLAPSHELEVIETRLVSPSGGPDRLIWHWYSIAGRRTAAPWRSKFVQVAGALVGRRDAMVVVLSVEGREVEELRRILRSFLLAHDAGVESGLSVSVPSPSLGS